MAYDEFTAKTVRKCSELEKALVEKDAAYQQLMEKAMRFAEFMEMADAAVDFGWRDFLQSPEVQAWKEQQNDTD